MKELHHVLFNAHKRGKTPPIHLVSAIEVSLQYIPDETKDIIHGFYKVLLIYPLLQVCFEDYKRVFIAVWDVVYRLDISIALVEVWCGFNHLDELRADILRLYKPVHEHGRVFTNDFKPDIVKDCFLCHNADNISLLLFTGYSLVFIPEYIFLLCCFRNSI